MEEKTSAFSSSEERVIQKKSRKDTDGENLLSHDFEVRFEIDNCCRFIKEGQYNSVKD